MLMRCAGVAAWGGSDRTYFAGKGQGLFIGSPRSAHSFDTLALTSTYVPSTPIKSM